MDANTQTFTLGDGNVENKPGTYPARFSGVAHHPEGEHGPHYIFEFRANSGEVYKGFADAPAGGPTPANKLGRWLCGLAGRPAKPGEQVNPSQHVGREYLLVYAPNTRGKVSLQSFTPVNAA